MLMEMRDDNLLGFLSETVLFQGLDQESLANLTSLFEIVTFGRGEFVISQGDLDESLYILISGKIRLTYQNNQRGDVIKAGLLERGDILNFEMLEPGTKAPFSARTVSSTTLVKINRKNLRTAVKQLPQIYKPLSVLFHSHKLALKKGAHSRFDDETIYYMNRRHPINLVFSLLLPLIFAGITIPLIITFYNSTLMSTGLLLLVVDCIVISLWVLWCIIDWINDYAVITSKRVLFEEKVMFFYHSQHESPMSAILSVTMATTIISRLFSYGDILVRTYTGMIVLPAQRDPAFIGDIVETLWKRNKDTSAEHQKEEVQTTLRRELGLPIENTDEIVDEEQPEDEYARQGAILSFFANVFSLIKEDTDKTTYWTHWIFLIKGLFFPAVLFSGLLVFSMYRTSGMINFMSDKSFYLLFGSLFLLTVLWLLYRYFDWRNDYYVISDEQVLDVYKKPLGREEKNSAQIKNILSIEFKRLGIIGLLLNYGTVYIRVGESTLTFDNVYNPAFIQQKLFRKMELLEQRTKEEREEAERLRMAEMIAAYHQMLTLDKNSTSNIEEIESD